MGALLSAERVHARHPSGDYDALRDVSLAVETGEILALVGPNGSGKSTLLSVLGRDLRVRSGRVTLAGAPVDGIGRRAFARRVARLPQEPSTPEGLTVEELVAYGRHPHRSVLGARARSEGDVVHAALSDVELADFRKRPIEQLSGGERRRAWIAMILAQEPEVMLLDEPTNALDLRHQWELLDLLERLNRERGTTIVLSLHDLEQAASIAHRIAMLTRGRLYDVGAPDAVLVAESLLDVYRVEAEVEAREGNLRVHVLGPGDPTRTF